MGNPLAKDYLNKIEDGTLRATSSDVAKRVLELNRSIIYWRNARDRILSQMVVWLDQSQMPGHVRGAKDFDPSGDYGAILPQVVATGTLTRRAVESTWMTASNAYTVKDLSYYFFHLIFKISTILQYGSKKSRHPLSLAVPSSGS